jgi:hypothetical protein
VDEEAAGAVEEAAGGVEEAARGLCACAPAAAQQAASRRANALRRIESAADMPVAPENEKAQIMALR